MLAWEQSASSLAYNLRVRAAALLDEGLRSGESRGRSNQGATNLPRLRALDTMVDNTMVQGRLALRQARLKQAESRRKSSARGASHVTVTAADEALRTVEEMLFMAVIMLSAGRIHLHRISWFGNLDLSFESCSFRPKPEKHAQTCTPPPVLRSGTSQRMHPHASVELPARTVTEEEMESLAQSISTNSGLRLQQQQLVLRLDQQHLVTSVAKIVSVSGLSAELLDGTTSCSCICANGSIRRLLRPTIWLFVLFGRIL